MYLDQEIPKVDLYLTAVTLCALVTAVPALATGASHCGRQTSLHHLCKFSAPSASNDSYASNHPSKGNF